MREIITLQVGGGGNAIGAGFFNVICGEHGIDYRGHFMGSSALQLERINVFFNEGRAHKYYYRSLAVDTDPESVDKVGRQFSQLYSPTNLIKGTGGTGNNFARGFYELGPKLMESVTDIIRLEAESCNSLQGFQIIHTLGGGTGSALSSLIWQYIRDNYKQAITQTISIIPSPKLSSVVVEPYNCVLSFPYLLANTDLTFCIDNEALHDICENRLKLRSASILDTNYLIAYSISGITSCLRFPGQLNTSLRKIYVNMVPFPNLHFLVPGFAPLISCDNLPFEKLSIKDMVNNMFNRNNMFAAIDFQKNKILTAASIFRGLVSTKDIDFAIQAVKTKYITSFLNWLPGNVQTAICDIPPIGLKLSATFIVNTTGMIQLFSRINKQFEAMYKRKAYLHWYTEYGMEESQFTDAKENLDELINYYKEKSADADKIRENDSNCCGGRERRSSNKSKRFSSNPGDLKKPNKKRKSSILQYRGPM